MILHRYYLECLAHASYLIGDAKTKTAVVVDPQRDIGQYLEDARKLGLEIKYVILTHFHADFVSGHIELRDKVGADIYLGNQAQAEYSFVPVKDGDALDLGDVRLVLLETPGHTPEGISVVVYDLAEASEKPHAVLTGDTLFIGDVGRPDLLASIGVTADELGSMLYHSLHEKLLQLPDDTLVYPAHGAGSMCGKNLSDESVSTIGEQRRYNYALQPMSLEAFKSIVTAEQPEAPPYFVHDAIMNRQDRPALQDTMEDSRQPLSLDEVLKLQRDGVQVVDVRSPADFAGAHLTGAINIGLVGKYANWCGTILDKDRPIVVVADNGDYHEAIMRLGRIGFDQVFGYLQNGLNALSNRPECVSTLPRMTAKALAEQLGSDLTVLDVRTEKEWGAGHIPNSINIPLNQLQRRLSELASDQTLVVHCAGGYRSAIAASLLMQQGFSNVFDLVGGYKAIRVAGFPEQVTADAGVSACSIPRAS